MGYLVGIDVGGTFTDCVAVSPDGRVYHAKALSTKSDAVTGMLDGIDSLALEIGLDRRGLLATTDRLAHGTTIGTNLVVERKGARVGLLATAGHGDAILMMRGAGGTAGKRAEDIFSPHNTRPPEPLVPRPAILEITERIDSSGKVLVELNADRTRVELARWLEQTRPEAVAIALLWSIRNPVHEQLLRKLLRELDPSLYLSLSSEITPRLGEFERSVAAAINAYVGPASSGYLSSLDRQMKGSGLSSQLLVMQSNGGVVDVDTAQHRPLSLLDSGPAGGLSGAAALARASGHTHVIATDMGGTSFDVGLVLDGQPVIAVERTIGQYTYLLPHIDVRSIACGGGSIATVNEHTRSITVGPSSAGSEPGPACYGRSGSYATVTDADVVLGLLRPEAFLNGRMPLDAEASRRVIEPIARAVGLSVEEAAAGIVRINNTNAALLIRERTLEQGLDPRDFVVYAFGGAGPVHAFGFAAELGVKSVSVPMGNGASTLSAYGIAAADTVRYFESECLLKTPFDVGKLSDAITKAQEAARRAVDNGQTTAIERSVLMRYAGQFYQSLAVPVPGGHIDEQMARDLLTAFETEYERLYGEGARIVFQSAEAFTVRTKVVGQRGHTPHAIERRYPREPVVKTNNHKVFWPAEARWLATAVVDGRTVGGGHIIDGPALVELPHTTVAVAPGQSLTADAFGSFVLSLNGEAV